MGVCRMNLVMGVGHCDEQCKFNGKHAKEYLLWRSILVRCYGGKTDSKNYNYQFCDISEEWKTYSVFKKDVRNMVGFGNKGWQLDKDILKYGNKIYSKDTCCFVPSEINSFFTHKKRCNTSEYIGITKRKDTKKGKPFAATMSKGGVKQFFGHFKTASEAQEVYFKEKQSYLEQLILQYSEVLDNRVIDALKRYDVRVNRSL